MRRKPLVDNDYLIEGESRQKYSSDCEKNYHMKKIFVISIFVLSFLALKTGYAQNSTTQTDATIDTTTRSQIIDAVIKNMKDYYVFPKVADEIEKSVRERQRKKEYDQITSAIVLAKLLTTHLREISLDKHVSVNYSEKPLPIRKQNEEPTAAEIQGLRNYGETINYGFQKVERLPGNIGYIRLNLFFQTEYGGDTAVAVMKVVAGTEALIIDLRGNDGGHPNMITLLASYFFKNAPVQLSGLYQRKTNAFEQQWTMPYVPGERYLDKEVYILTSKRTFSGGEAFAYDLKNLNRATLIGETTEGAANPRDVFRINEHFWIGIPNARPISPITQTNWEGTGVKPDIEVPAEQALKTAQLVALKKFLTTATDENRINNLNKFIEALQKELDELKKKS
jgi:C-terminal processing protease CtpA/Prc